MTAKTRWDRQARQLGSWALAGILFFAGSPLGSPVAAAEKAKAAKGKAVAPKASSKDFVVSGEDKLKVRSDKLLRLLFVDLDKPIQEMMVESSELSQKILPDQQLLQYEKSGMTSQSRMTFSPWLNLITKQPVLVVQARRSKLRIKSWKFVISDEVGNILYRKNGGGSLPKNFIWDGIRQNGKLVDVGESFYYSLTMTDQADNPLFTSSKPRKLSSIAYFQNNELRINLLSSVLFDPKIRSSLSPVGRSLLKESCDYIIKNIGRETHIIVNTNHIKLGKAQGRTVKDFITGKLALPKGDFKIKVVNSSDPVRDYVGIACRR